MNPCLLPFDGHHSAIGHQATITVDAQSLRWRGLLMHHACIGKGHPCTTHGCCELCTCSLHALGVRASLAAGCVGLSRRRPPTISPIYNFFFILLFYAISLDVSTNFPYRLDTKSSSISWTWLWNYHQGFDTICGDQNSQSDLKLQRDHTIEIIEIR